MPRLRLKYELEQFNRHPDEVGVEFIEFSDKIIDIESDRDPLDYNKFRNTNSYYVYPPSSNILIRILAGSTNFNYYWNLKVWLVDKSGNTVKHLNPHPDPIKQNVDPSGGANYDENLPW